MEKIHGTLSGGELQVDDRAELSTLSDEKSAGAIKMDAQTPAMVKLAFGLWAQQRTAKPGGNYSTEASTSSSCDDRNPPALGIPPRARPRVVGAADRRLHPHPPASAWGNCRFMPTPHASGVLRCGRQFKEQGWHHQTLETIGDPWRQWGFRHGPPSAGSRRCTSTGPDLPGARGRASALSRGRSTHRKMTITLPAGEWWSAGACIQHTRTRAARVSTASP